MSLRPDVSIVITTHGSALDLPGMLHAIANQREYGEGKHSRTGQPICCVPVGDCPLGYEVIVVTDGPSGIDDLRMAPYYNRLVVCPKENHPAGHHTREPGIMTAEGVWIVLTNSDNYFCAGWLWAIADSVRNPGVGMIYWDIANSLGNWRTHPSKLARGHIDLSCVAVRREIAQQVGFPFREYDGDADYILACAKLVKSKNLGIAYLPQLLAVHN